MPLSTDEVLLFRPVWGDGGFRLPPPAVLNTTGSRCQRYPKADPVQEQHILLSPPVVPQWFPQGDGMKVGGRWRVWGACWLVMQNDARQQSREAHRVGAASWVGPLAGTKPAARLPDTHLAPCKMARQRIIMPRRSTEVKASEVFNFLIPLFSQKSFTQQQHLHIKQLCDICGTGRNFCLSHCLTILFFISFFL